MLWRSIQDSSVWNNAKPEALKVAIYMMLNARFQDGEWVSNQGDVITLTKGQLVIGRKQAASDCHLSEQTFRTCLKFLKKTKFLTITSTNKFSVITICKYGSYQSGNHQPNQLPNQQTNQHLTSTQPALNQHLTTNNNVENVENVNNGENNTKQPKNKYGEFGNVKLTNTQYEALLAKNGEDTLKAGIQILDDYLEQSDKRYNSHYAVLKETSWVWQRLQESTGQKPKPSNYNQKAADEWYRVKNQIMDDYCKALDKAGFKRVLWDKYKDIPKLAGKHVLEACKIEMAELDRITNKENMERKTIV